MSSNPAHVAMKTSSVRKAVRNHTIKSTCLEKLTALSLVSGTLEIEYATQEGGWHKPSKSVHPNEIRSLECMLNGSGYASNSVCER